MTWLTVAVLFASTIGEARVERLCKGANVALTALTQVTGPVIVALHWTDPSGEGGGDADVAALLVGASGKVRGDADFVFYNQPAAAEGAVQLLGKAPTGGGSEDRVLLDLAALPDDVERVVVTAGRYAGATFGELGDLGVTLYDASGTALVRFDIDDAGPETAFIFGELYRRGGDWKFRAVGQGYASGLAGLATEFGISVDDDEAEAETEGGEDGGPAREASSPEPGKPPARAGTGKVRTRKKRRSTLPKPKVDLADHASWQRSRLFPVSGLRSEQERETRATSMLLAVMAQVPEFGRRLTARFGAPAGTVQTFTETSFPHGDGKVRPDGVLRVGRAGRVWTALVETKTGGSPLKAAQVEAYLEVAARNGYEAVITLSNDVALDGEHPLTVDRRRVRKTALRHLSWAEVAHEAHMLCHHHGSRTRCTPGCWGNCCTTCGTTTPDARGSRTWGPGGCRSGTRSGRGRCVPATGTSSGSRRTGNGSSGSSACG